MAELAERLARVVRRPPGSTEAAAGATAAVRRVTPAASRRRVTTVVSSTARGVRVQSFGGPSPRYLREVRTAAAKGGQAGLTEAGRKALS